MVKWGGHAQIRVKYMHTGNALVSWTGNVPARREGLEAIKVRIQKILQKLRAADNLSAGGEDRV